MDTKKLRQKILDLAIRGKLVPQDPNDEPASVLLERIRAEKERLIKEGKIKRSKKSASDDEIEAPFEIPESWEWVRLGDLLLLLSGQDFPPQKYNSDSIGIPYIIGASNIENEKLYVNRWTDVPSVISLLNDVLVVCKGAGVGKIAMNNVGEVHIARQIQAVRDETGILDNRYIKISIASNIADIISKANGLIPGLKRELLLSLMIPIAPLSEQKRIANAVERWFTLIDELESNEGDLLKAIDKAKSKILDLAIHGKLVPQDPNDEPAIDLLKRINPKFEACSDSLYETLPNGWEVCIMNDIASSELGKTLDKEKNKGEYKPYLCSINVFWNHFVLNEMKQMRFEINELEHYSIHQGDLVICEGGDAGRCAVWPNSYSVLFQNAIHRVRFKENIDSYFYMYVIMYLKNKHILDNYCKGVTIKHFTKTALLSLPVPLPPINEQLRIVAKIEELFAVLDSIKESLEV